MQAIPFILGAVKVAAAAKAVKSVSGGGGGDVQVPAAPTLDTAVKNRDEVDRLRKRRGVLGTIFGGANGTAPTVATKKLLGE